MAEAQLFRDEPVDTLPADMELPEQFGSFSVLMPGTRLFQLPANLSQVYELYNEHPRTPDGTEDKTQPAKQRIRFKFDNTAPLTVVSECPEKGDTLKQSISSSPRKRGKKGSDAPSVADLAYLLRIALQDKTPVTTTKEWHAAVSKYAGQFVRLATGLQGSCRADKVRFVDDGQGGTVADPAGTMGCGKRYYTKSFKQDDGSYGTELDCECGAVVRGFSNIEQYLPPLEGKK